MPSPAEPQSTHSRSGTSTEHQFTWMGSAADFHAAQLSAIASAAHTIRMEVYIFTESGIGHAFREALTAAAHRGVDVALLTDRFGSGRLPRTFFQPLEAAGGRHRSFSPLRPGRWTLRNHRKVLLVDDRTAFVGGCNVSDEYMGDGVAHGWRDGGISVTGPIAETLAEEFGQQWARAEQSTWKLVRGGYCRTVGSHAEVSALFIKPGLGENPLRSWLREDLKSARDVAITSAYFLPTRRLSQQLIQADRRGARVRLLLAGRSDVPLLQTATRSMHHRLLRGGIEVFEYLPQILHAKTLVLDDVVYVGSSNLDPRSLRINFEIMLRIKNAALADRVREQFETDLRNSRAVTVLRERGLAAAGRRILERVARFIFTRLDPWIARDQLRRHATANRRKRQDC
jgi:cardiolipin synthase